MVRRSAFPTPRIKLPGACKVALTQLAVPSYTIVRVTRTNVPSETDTTNIPTFEISHNANDDMCEAYFTKELRFDLNPLKQAGVNEFLLTAKLPDGEIYKEIFKME
jgi:hypothetical protein